MKQHAAILNMVGAALSALNFPLYIVLLSPVEYGQWIIVSSIAAFVGLFELGLSLSMQRAVVDQHAAEKRRHLVKIIGYSFVGTLVVTIAGYFYLNHHESSLIPYREILAALILCSVAEALANTNGLMQGSYFVEGQSKTIGILRIFSSLTRIVFTLIALLNGFGVLGIAVAMLMAQLIETLFFSPRITRYLQKPTVPEEPWQADESRSRLAFSQWTLNLSQRFGFRLLILTLGVSLEGTHQSTLVKIGQASIIYRAFEFTYLIIKSATPAYYQEILSESTAVALKSATTALLKSFALIVIAIATLLTSIHPDSLPETLLFLPEAGIPIALGIIYFLLMLLIEPTQYRTMMRNIPPWFKSMQMLILATALLLLLVLPISNAATLLFVALLIPRVAYLHYLIHHNQQSLKINYKMMLSSISNASIKTLTYSLPLWVVFLLPLQLDSKIMIALLTGVVGLYTAIHVVRINRR